MEMNHLTDNQWTELLSPDNRASEHVAHCEACRNEWDKLQKLANGLAAAARSATEQPEVFFERQRLSIQRQIANVPGRRTRSARLVWAAVFALVLIASFLLKTGSRVPVQPSVPDSDRELLVQVEQALDGDVPQALQPASLIANEIDRSAEPQSNSTSSKEKSEHEN
jgi:hypothetical protein